jgi:hypothetical protein
MGLIIQMSYPVGKNQLSPQALAEEMAKWANELNKLRPGGIAVKSFEIFKVNSYEDDDEDLCQGEMEDNSEDDTEDDTDDDTNDETDTPKSNAEK